jgi:hypothetical protein
VVQPLRHPAPLHHPQDIERDRETGHPLLVVAVGGETVAQVPVTETLTSVGPCMVTVSVPGVAWGRRTGATRRRNVLDIGLTARR